MRNSSYYANIFHNCFRNFIGMDIPFQVLVNKDTKELSGVHLWNYFIIDYEPTFRARNKLFTRSKNYVVGFGEIKCKFVGSEPVICTS